MGLSPDEIAHRAFTPSADGYHQGEVRSFLNRIASDLQGLLSALPEGRAQIAELTATLHAHEPHLATMSDRLENVLAELNATNAAVQETQAEAMSYLVAAKELATEHAAATIPAQGQEEAERAQADLVAEQRAIIEQLTAEHAAVTAQLATARSMIIEQRATAEQLAALGAEQRAAAAELAAAGRDHRDQLETAHKLAAEQRDAGEYLAAVGQEQTSQLETATRLVDKQAAAFATSGRLAAKLEEAATAQAARAASTGPAPAAAPATTTPATTTPATAPAAPSTLGASAPAAAGRGIETMALFGSDLDEQPLFSDNANDLLDGVLDDVMGNLTDEGDPS